MGEKKKQHRKEPSCSGSSSPSWCSPSRSRCISRRRHVKILNPRMCARDAATPSGSVHFPLSSHPTADRAEDDSTVA